jgi:hypothetical protein
MAHQVALRFNRLSIFAHSIHRLSKLAGGWRGPRFCRSKPSILIGTQERPHRLHHTRSPKLFFARRSAMPGDHAIIVTAEVSQQERLRRTQDNPRPGVGRPLLFSEIELALSSKPQDWRDADCSWSCRWSRSMWPSTRPRACLTPPPVQPVRGPVSLYAPLQVPSL